VTESRLQDVHWDSDQRLSELGCGKRKVYGNHDVMSKVGNEKRMAEIHADYKLEIKELKARV